MIRILMNLAPARMAVWTDALRGAFEASRGEVRTGMRVERLLVEGERDRDERIAELGFIPQVYSPSFDLVNDSLRTWTTRLGMKLIPWTVNDPTDMQRMIDLGVDGIITDYPDRLVKLVESSE